MPDMQLVNHDAEQNFKQKGSCHHKTRPGASQADSCQNGRSQEQEDEQLVHSLPASGQPG